MLKNKAISRFLKDSRIFLTKSITQLDDVSSLLALYEDTDVIQALAKLQEVRKVLLRLRASVDLLSKLFG